MTPKNNPPILALTNWKIFKWIAPNIIDEIIIAVAGLYLFKKPSIIIPLISIFWKIGATIINEITIR